MNWMSSHGMDALLKTICVIGAVHVVLLILGAFLGNEIGWLGMRMFWPHFSWGIGTTATAVVLTVILYWLIYSFWHENETA